MSDYKRLFSYLYFYQHKIKEKNSGFVKVEIRNNQCRLQMSVKGGFLNRKPRWDVYGFMRDGRELRLWRLGQMNAGNGQGEWGVQMPLTRFLGDASDLNRVAGLLLCGSQKEAAWEQLPDVEDDRDGLICATVWDDFPLFAPGEPPKEILHAAQVDEPEAQEQPEEGELLQAEAAEAMYDTREEWDTLRELLEEKEVEKMMADMAVPPEAPLLFGPPEPSLIRTEPCREEKDRQPEKFEDVREQSETEKEREIRRRPLETGQEQPETVRDRGQEQPETVRDRGQEQPEAARDCIREQPETVRDCIQEPPGTDRNGRQSLSEARQETEQERCPSEVRARAGAGRKPGCPCPDQCIWSDMYQEPPKSLWMKLVSFYPKLMINGLGSDWEILKIMPRDIGRLPRENWVYGNNSFLLHGYYRHHHLILACYRGTTPHQYYLGVPGCCSDRERVMASMFGFTNYLPGGKRGYWYTPINLGNN